MRTFESEWRARFERFARTYEDDARISGWSEAGLRRRLALFRSLLPSLGLSAEARVLELGCGAGTYVRLLAGLGYWAVGLDYSLPSLGRALASDPGRKGRYVGGETYALPFKAETFDLVVSVGVLQALRAPERALDEMVRTLRPGGILVVEALNARAAIAMGRRAAEAIRGLAPRVQTYDPRQVRRWLADRRLAVVRQAALYLPPRRLPGLERFLAWAPLASTLGRSRGLQEMVAHSFLFVGQKAGECPRSRP